MKQVKILAFYPDEDREVWTKHQNEIPDGWINSYDKELTVLTEECYDDLKSDACSLSVG